MKRRRQRGFTLVDILAGLTLFAIVASAVALLATQSVRRTVENRHSSAAVLLAQRELERLRGLDYPLVAGGVTSASMGGQAYTITTSVQTDAPAPNMKQIAVVVSWTGPEGARSYGLHTIYTDVTGS